MSDTPSHSADSSESATPETASRPWADVQPEHFKMLRLAPLPIDRSTGARPLRFVQFGYAERHSKALSLLRLSVSVPGQHLRKEQNQLDIWLDHSIQRVSISPERGLLTEPLNRGIGGFLIAQGAQWVQKKWPTYCFESLDLPAKYALQEDMRLRRDHCLRTQGFDVVYEDALLLKARIEAGQAADLYTTWNNEKIQFVEILDAAQMLQQAEQNLQEQELKLRGKDERISKYQREDTGLRFTIACLVAFAVFQAGLLIWIATHR
ncbi:hypothetical protein AQS70_03950 [Pseudomonas endophytica]|uniref:Uncharacterized protein n=1 Tax=Pseudomonas endophytica TaxID=1563157 RepID=A0A0Q0YST9_9PSED|nr:hypothetical protein [Pseudomonas endophytica]KQB52086.1 hypothetical protein AQS70_03950 [Pseudomonas endophytica]